MEVTELGILIEANFEQFRKVSSPIEVTELGRVTDVSPQLENARSPIEVTELGMEIYSRL